MNYSKQLRGYSSIMEETCKKVIFYSTQALFTIILLFIFLLECTVLYLQKYNLIPLFNLIISFDSYTPITRATVQFTKDNIKIGGLFKVLHISAHKLKLQERISKLKFQIIYEKRGPISNHIQTICIENETITYSTANFIIFEYQPRYFVVNLA